LPLKKVAAIAPPATLAGRQQDKPKMPEPTPEAMRAAARVLAARSTEQASPIRDRPAGGKCAVGEGEGCEGEAASTDAVSAVRAAEAAFALYAAAECFAGISLNPLEEGVEYAERAIAALPPGFGHPDLVREIRKMVEARDWRLLEMTSRELDTWVAARPPGESGKNRAERSVVSQPRRQRKPSIRTLIQQAEKAGKPVTSVTTPDGITLRFDQPEPAEASNPWLAELDKVTKQ
jgi:hypothetical protein